MNDKTRERTIADFAEQRGRWPQGPESTTRDIGSTDNDGCNTPHSGHCESQLMHRGGRIALARGPPAWDDTPELLSDWGLFGQPEPCVEFDQRVFSGCAADARTSTPERVRLHRARRPSVPLLGVDGTFHSR